MPEPGVVEAEAEEGQDHVDLLVDLWLRIPETEFFAYEYRGWKILKFLYVPETI